ncbi:MAG: UDP-N-acetylglucosamine--N-acetylmuramyl-(pentapeptide) pyrophosphoryl-undecaprenol N-acetylglucosamine transferase [Verrucomicrobiales bacterium]|jgi:UDP-N-acetylglucosamine--N-acetylmuramyl-(pentapeptide) pyrophosphoryl-undecaprenol N-acetylglucosamine transferase
MRFCHYAINGIGLGHLARTIAIARALGIDEHDHLFLTSSPATDLLEMESLPYIQFPSDHHLAEKTLALKDKTYSRLLHGIVSATINAYDPHVFVVDTLPTGSRGELAQLATCARRSVFILREQRKPLAPEIAAAINRYTHILIPHRQGETPIPAGIDPAKVTFTGPILLRSKEDPPAAKLPIILKPEQKLVGVAFGGGGDKDFAKLIRWVERCAADHPNLHFAISIPPLLRERITQPDSENVTYFEQSPLADLWQRFDFVISAAGYNSTNELVHFGVPTILVPLERPLDDQFARARGLAEQGAARIVSAFDDASLGEAISFMKDPKSRARMSEKSQSLLPQNGASIAASVLTNVAG